MWHENHLSGAQSSAFELLFDFKKQFGGMTVSSKIKYTNWGCGQKLGPNNLVQEASPCILVKIE